MIKLAELCAVMPKNQIVRVLDESLSGLPVPMSSDPDMTLIKGKAKDIKENWRIGQYHVEYIEIVRDNKEKSPVVEIYIQPAVLRNE